MLSSSVPGVDGCLASQSNHQQTACRRVSVVVLFLPSKDSYLKAFGPKDPILYGFLGYSDAKGSGCLNKLAWGVFMGSF